MKKHPEGRATSPGRSFPLHDFSSATPLGSGSSPLGIRRSGRRPTSGHFLPCLSAWGAISGGSDTSFPPPADNSEMRPADPGRGDGDPSRYREVEAIGWADAGEAGGWQWAAEARSGLR